MCYGLTLLICASVLYVNTNELPTASLSVNGVGVGGGVGNAYGKKNRVLEGASDTEKIAIVIYNAQLYFQDYYVTQITL